MTTDPTKNTDVSLDDFFGGVNFESDRDYGSPYPVITWLNGMPNRAEGHGQMGCFFYDEDTGINVEGAEPYVHVNNDGDKIKGFALPKLRIACVHIRRSWLVRPEQGLPQRFPWSEYEPACETGKPRGVTHILGYIEGCDEKVCVVFSGMAGNAFASRGKQPGIHSLFGTKVVMPARRLLKKDFPTYAFYVEVGPTLNKKGEPVFTKVGKPGQQSTICLPSWLNEPENLDVDFIKSIYVGPERVTEAMEVYKGEGQDWWDKWSPEHLANLRNRGAATVAGRKGEDGLDDSEPEDAAVPGAGDMPF